MLTKKKKKKQQKPETKSTTVLERKMKTEDRNKESYGGKTEVYILNFLFKELLVTKSMKLRMCFKNYCFESLEQSMKASIMLNSQ